MYFSHTFARHETLSRAYSWLTQLGFHPREVGPQASGSPRLVIVDDAPRVAAAKLVINAAEHADPDGFKGFWDKEPQPDRAAVPSHLHAPTPWHEMSYANGASHPRKLADCVNGCFSKALFSEERRPSVIGWHPLD